MTLLLLRRLHQVNEVANDDAGCGMIHDLMDEGFQDWDAQTQEGMVNALHNVDHALDSVHFLLSNLTEENGI